MRHPRHESPQHGPILLPTLDLECGSPILGPIDHLATGAAHVRLHQVAIAERFANVPRTYRLRGLGATVYRLGVPKPDAPWWHFEAYGTIKWGSAANGASKLVEDFIETNYDAMAPASQ